MKLILIHGRDQHDRIADDLKEAWLQNLQYTLERVGKEIPSFVSIELPFYGYILKKIVDDGGVASGIRSKGFETGNDVIFVYNLIAELAANVGIPVSEVFEAMDRPVERGIENWDMVQKMLEIIDSKTKIGNLVIKKFTLDVFYYLNRQGVRDQINEIVSAAFGTGPCVIVGHSLGSVIAYDVLKDMKLVKHNSLVTVGSPLGIRAIYSKLKSPLVRPPSLYSWFNAYDNRDVVALKPLEGEAFDFTPRVFNDGAVINDTEGHHGIEGYLNHLPVAEAIYNGLIKS